MFALPLETSVVELANVGRPVDTSTQLIEVNLQPVTGDSVTLIVVDPEETGTFVSSYEVLSTSAKFGEARFTAEYGNSTVDDVPVEFCICFRIFTRAGDEFGGVGLGDGVGVGVAVGVGCGTPLMNVYRSKFADVESMLVTIPAVAELLIAFVTVAALAAGFTLKYRAAVPATTGEAIDVPLRALESVSFAFETEVTACPGANRSRHDP